MFPTGEAMSKHPASVTGQINYKQTGTFIEQTSSIIQSIKDFDSQAKEISTCFLLYFSTASYRWTEEYKKEHLYFIVQHLTVNFQIQVLNL